MSACFNNLGASICGERGVSVVEVDNRNSFLVALRTCLRCLMQFPSRPYQDDDFLRPVAARPTLPSSFSSFCEKSLSRGAINCSYSNQLLNYDSRRARYDNQRNPVSRIATVMNSSDVAARERKTTVVVGHHQDCGAPCYREH